MTAVTESSLQRLLGRPFGRDEQGQVIDHGSGKLIIGAIDALRAIVGEQAARALGPSATPAARAAAAANAESAALDRLVAMLNQAIGDGRYHVTPAYLLNEGNLYSYEFRLFVAEYCRIISGAPDFFRQAGASSIPRAVAMLGRPLGLQRVYAVLPRFTAKFVKTDLRVVETTPLSARLEWRGAEQANLVPEPHRIAYIRYACETYKGAFASIPSTLFGSPAAEVKEIRCQADGADRCEWEFRFTAKTTGTPKVLLGIGGGASVVLILLALRFTAVQPALVAAGAVLPVGVAWYLHRTNTVGRERDRLRQELFDERDLAEGEYDRGERANADLQVANATLGQRVAELTVLHDVAQALSTTLDLDTILDRSLDAVVRHLGFDRAMVLLADEEAGVLTGGRAVGAAPEMIERIRNLRVPVDTDGSQLVQAFRATETLLFTNVDQDPIEANREFARALKATSFVGTPLITKDRSIGVLAVDNGLSGRALDGSTFPLLLTLGRQVAAAVDTARLYGEVEAANRTLEERVTDRTAALARTAADLERELAERRRLRERELEYLSQVNRVVAAAGAVESGTFDPESLAETAARDDEIGQLARTFRRMAEHMLDRQAELQREVLELRFEVDETRRASQIAEIVDSDYFRQLRDQARDLRKLAESR